MSKIADRNALLVEQMRDVYSAEKQLVAALPKMAKAAASDELRTAFENHLDATRTHVKRLEEAFKLLEITPRAKHCKGMEGLIEEGTEATETDGPNDVINGALIAAAQRVEHYEIAAYGTMHALAEQLGHDELAGIFAETLEEEKEADELLTDIAMSESGAVGTDESDEDEDAVTAEAKPVTSGSSKRKR